MAKYSFEFYIGTIKITQGNSVKEIPINKGMTLEQGSLCILSGKSGSGKSLCCQFLAGVSPDRDYTKRAIDFNGSSKCFKPCESEFLADIQIVPQSLNRFFVAPTPSEEVEFSFECHDGRNGIKNKRRAFMHQLDIVKHTHSLIPNLSAGERQLVAVGSAIARSPKVLILDEPEHFLSNTFLDCFLKFIKKYIEDGGILILSSHNQNIYTNIHGSPVFLPIDDYTYSNAVSSAYGPGHIGEKALEINGSDILSQGESPSILFSFEKFVMNKKECILLTGSNGSGKTTFLRTLCGFVNNFPPEMKVNNRNISGRNPPLFPDEIAYISYDPIAQMFHGTPSEMLSPENSDYDSAWTENASKLLNYLKAYGVEPNRKIADMSYGERQIVALSSYPNIPNILLVDEPPFSYEAGQMQVINDILKFYLEKGSSILLSTHYPEFYKSISSRNYQIQQHWLEE